jgi:hypothetical protein
MLAAEAGAAGAATTNNEPSAMLAAMKAVLSP